ncbi:cell division cycle-associated protein 3 [Cygnus atratus]|uniref:cell division cycle-associated protein 3 n=1 Tax=Cygnus atratus TaxID=8868 RepID=UPI0015D6580D|nr:cell division cycle-associated protein 3 [Cygnus atratus]
MGASGSAPATPAPPRGRRPEHVRDPRSPSAGILRTPIEVLSSPPAGGSPQPGPAAEAAGPAADPRSPTPGISRTPMKDALSDSVERLVKQLSEAFGVQTEPPAAARPRREPAAAPGREAERPPSPGGCCEATPRAPRHAGTAPAAGSKYVRRKAGNKIMVTSGGNGRSPFSVLQDDNSPSASAPHQVKRHVLGENLGEKETVAADLSRNLKAGNCPWSDLNKENQQCPFVEN